MIEPDMFKGADDAPTIDGVAVAKVTNNEDPEGLGRVKVTYPFRDTDDESYWARVVTEMASKDYGTWFLPEVGDEVLVAFEDGNIRYPFVVGSLYNGKRKPPESNSDGNNDIRSVTSRKGHVLEFDDASSGGKVEIETNAGHTITLDDKSGAETITIQDKSGSNTIEMKSSGGEVSISAGKKLSLSAKEIEISADKEVDISSKANVKMSGKAKVDISSKGQLNMSSSGLGKLKASGPLQIKGAIIQLN